MAKKIELGKEYRYVSDGDHLMVFFAYDPVTEGDYKFLMIDKSSYTVLDAYKTKEDGACDIYDLPYIVASDILRARAVGDKMKANFTYRDNECDYTLFINDSECTFIPNLTVEEYDTIEKLCDALEVEKELPGKSLWF